MRRRPSLRRRRHGSLSCRGRPIQAKNGQQDRAAEPCRPAPDRHASASKSVHETPHAGALCVIDALALPARKGRGG
jgi:hypothetical protein